MKLEFSRKLNGRTEHEEEPFQRRADHRGIEAARGRDEDGGVVPGTWDQRGDVLGYWGATEQKTRLRIQVTSTIEPDGLRSGRNWGMATIRDRLGHMTATQGLGSIKYLLLRANLRQCAGCG